MRLLLILSKIGAVVCIAACVFGVLLLIGRGVRIETVEVIGMTASESARVRSAYQKRAYRDIQEEQLRQWMGWQFPHYQVSNIQKEFPSRLLIQVKKAPAIAQVMGIDGYFLVNKDLRILGKSKKSTEGLPVIRWYMRYTLTQMPVGTVLEAAVLRKSGEIIEGMRALGMVPGYVDIDSVDMIVCKLRSGEIVFSQTKESADQLYLLEQVATHMRSAGVGFKRIDLRFDKPVIQKK